MVPDVCDEFVRLTRRRTGRAQRIWADREAERGARRQTPAARRRPQPRRSSPCRGPPATKPSHGCSHASMPEGPRRRPRLRRATFSCGMSIARSARRSAMRRPRSASGTARSAGARNGACASTCAPRSASCRSSWRRRTPPHRQGRVGARPSRSGAKFLSETRTANRGVPAFDRGRDVPDRNRHRLGRQRATPTTSSARMRAGDGGGRAGKGGRRAWSAGNRRHRGHHARVRPHPRLSGEYFTTNGVNFVPQGGQGRDLGPRHEQSGGACARTELRGDPSGGRDAARRCAFGTEIALWRAERRSRRCARTWKSLSPSLRVDVRNDGDATPALRRRPCSARVVRGRRRGARACRWAPLPWTLARASRRRTGRVLTFHSRRRAFP